MILGDYLIFEVDISVYFCSNDYLACFGQPYGLPNNVLILLLFFSFIFDDGDK